MTRTARKTGHTLGGGGTEARQQRVRQGARRCRWWPALVTAAVAQMHRRARVVGAAATMQDANRGKTLLGLMAAVAQAGRGKKK